MAVSRQICLKPPKVRERFTNIISNIYCHIVLFIVLIAQIAIIYLNYYAQKPIVYTTGNRGVSSIAPPTTTTIKVSTSWRTHPNVDQLAQLNLTLPRYWLQKGIVSYGDMLRPRALMNKVLNGQGVTISVLGGSISWGHGVNNHTTEVYGAIVMDWFKRTFPNANHTFVNGAIPGTPSSYMALCVDNKIPQESDIILVEYNINDGSFDKTHPMRKAHERMLQRILK
jgi:hypothetical protein